MVLYGSGIRLEECLHLRVKDLDFDRHHIIVGQGKGQKDRVTMLPAAVRDLLTGHLADVRRLHAADLARELGRVALPFAARSIAGDVGTRHWLRRWQPIAACSRQTFDLELNRTGNLGGRVN
jgi:integrase